MKVKELILLLSNIDPDYEVVICDNGSILKTGTAQATQDYNAGSTTEEFYIETEEWE